MCHIMAFALNLRNFRAVCFLRLLRPLKTIIAQQPHVPSDPPPHLSCDSCVCVCVCSDCCCPASAAIISADGIDGQFQLLPSPRNCRSHSTNSSSITGPGAEIHH